MHRDSDTQPIAALSDHTTVLAHPLHQTGPQSEAPAPRPARAWAWTLLYLAVAALLVAFGGLIGGYAVAEMTHSDADLDAARIEAAQDGYDSGYRDGRDEAAADAAGRADAAYDAGYAKGHRDGADEANKQSQPADAPSQPSTPADKDKGRD